MVKQKYLSSTMILISIIFMSAFIPLSIDLYLPALPQMGAYFHASEMLLNFTLISFFFFFSVGIVIFGPFSDKYGRRASLLGGALLYTAASLVCAASESIYLLIAGRIFQAFGAGCIVTISTALIKDCFSGKEMTRILSITQALNVFAPMAAPIVGSLLLLYTSWRGAFVLLAFLGGVNVVIALLLTEPLLAENRYQGTVLQSVGLLWKFTKHTFFMLILIMFSCLAAPYMAYVSVSSFVYMEGFHLSPQLYSIYYSVNSACAIIGPFLYLRITGKVADRKITNACFVIAGLSGVAVLTIGHWSPLGFMLAFLPFTLIESVVRPFTMDLLLKMVKTEIGTASALINFVPTLLGSVGMFMSTLPWNNFIDGLGIIILGAAAIATLFLIYLRILEGRTSH
jgi:DHA1 family bicyclomycin/chloramphenicol resistance-like MFS transporter